jgi:hypothetical protein
MTLELIFDIVLIGIIVYAFVLCAIVLKGFIKERFFRPIAFRVALPFGLLLVAYLLYNLVLHNIEPSDWAQIFLVLGLVVVTGYYALVAFRQADEMKEQRYSALRPIIDINRESSLTNEEIGEIRSIVESGNMPEKLICTLRNIGPGPAIDVYSLTKGANGKPLRYDLGTIAADNKEGEMTLTRQLLIERVGDRAFLVAYYKDAYGQCFKSSREVRIKEGHLDTDRLTIIKLPKEECNR